MTCPRCRETIRIERLSHGWLFCARCGVTWLVGDCGEPIRVVTSNHSRDASTCATDARAAGD